MALERLFSFAGEPQLDEQRHRSAKDIAVRGKVLLRPAEVEPIVGGRVGVERFAGRDYLRKGFVLDRNLAAGGNEVEDLALEKIGSGVDLVGRFFTLGRFLDESADFSAGVVHHAAERRRI